MIIYWTRSEKCIFTELFIYSGLETNINKRAEANTFENGFELTTGYTGQEFKFYKNGILRKSGILSNNEIVSGAYIVTGTNKVVFSDPLEEDGFAPDAFYDYITGQTTYVTYSPSIDYSYTTSPYVDSDVFFNGQKLLSGRSLVYHTDSDGTDLEIDETLCICIIFTRNLNNTFIFNEIFQKQEFLIKNSKSVGFG